MLQRFDAIWYVDVLGARFWRRKVEAREVKRVLELTVMDGER